MLNMDNQQRIALKMAARNFLPRCIALELQIFRERFYRNSIIERSASRLRIPRCHLEDTYSILDSTLFKSFRTTKGLEDKEDDLYPWADRTLLL